MTQELVSFATIVTLFGVLPAILVGGVVAGWALRLRSRQLDLRAQELELERQRLAFLTTENQKQLLDRLDRSEGP